VAPEKILKHILNQYIKNLDNNPAERKMFVQNGGLKKLQELKSKVSEPLREKIDSINDKYPPEIIKYYSPDYAASLLQKIDNYSGD
jgi:hypothetical protein